LQSHLVLQCASLSSPFDIIYLIIAAHSVTYKDENKDVLVPVVVCVSFGFVFYIMSLVFEK